MKGFFSNVRQKFNQWFSTPSHDPVEEEILIDADQYVERLTGIIAQAKKEICLSFYILEPDPFGTRVLDLLREKSKMGVKVRLIVDGVGSAKWIEKFRAFYQEAGLDVRVYHPIPWQIYQSRWVYMFRLHLFFRLFYLFNQRNHNKLIVVDGQVAILGSRNLCENALRWRETSLWVKGNSTGTALQNIFENIWQRSHDRRFHRLWNRSLYSPIALPKNIISNHVLALRLLTQSNLVRRIKESQHDIQITTPYFFPRKKILRLLCRKARQGVNVAIILPRLTDVAVSRWIGQLFYGILLSSNVEIYEYTAGILHAKSLRIDQWAMVGSSNFNRRSFHRDLEIDYALAHPKTFRQLDHQFHLDLAHCVRIQTKPHMQFWKKAVASMMVRLVPSWF